jgi:hypothetical protein
MSKRTSTSSNETPSPRRRASKPAGNGEAAPKPRATRTRRTQPAATAPVQMAADAGAAPGAAEPRRPTHDEIAMRAYYIALDSGFQSDPFVDWLTAERELAKALV